ncbi:cytochrome P450 [Parasphingorhabdus sp. NYA22]
MSDEAQFLDKSVVIPDPYSISLDQINMAQPMLFQNNAHGEYFRRLRNEDPVHYCAESEVGPFWSITKYDDIVKIDSNHKQFSSEPTISMGNPSEDFTTPMFIAMDPPKHDVQRKAANPGVAPARLADLEGLIRERAGKILDDLPVGQEFNWVDRVSIELTTQMLATLFDFPFEDRRLLTKWSDVTTDVEMFANEEKIQERREILRECLAYFTRLWLERAEQPPKFDFISLMAHNPDTKDMINNPMELLGNLILLIVGGNDTTRNSISAGIVALNQNPQEYDKLLADQTLVPNMVSEIIRWQTPLAYMRRTAKEDVEFQGKQIKKGDKIVMWYVSGNRDETKIENADAFLIDRARARQHMSFGFGIHRCMGNRVGEMQVRILWEEILKRFDRIEMVRAPIRVKSSFVMGYSEVMVRVKPKG